ncbi:betaine--homocysteine S-methyltransferase 1-like [Mytilus edulis]|uniref:betaine--homocysteine S-methyltransferase 1-like n=1 Tax=Mytilus edulis TaxID=6550 RepID=UPI0039F08ECF
MPKKGLKERIQAGDNIIVAEGYIFEFERRGYLRAGCFVPEVVLEHPEQVKAVHEEYVHAGSDVVLAFTYYGHREKLKLIGREADLKSLNIKALRLAKEVADRTNTLLAGNICNSTIYKRDCPDAIEKTRAIFKEQIEWAIAEGVDYIVAESFSEYGEAALALECIKEYGKVPAVVTMIAHAEDKTVDGLMFGEAMNKLYAAGADIVGLNCGRGPTTMLSLIGEIRKTYKGPMAALPVPYRTTPDEPTFLSIINPETGKDAFPEDLTAFHCSRTQIRKFAEEAKELGVQYVGLCCGNASHFMRIVAEVYGRTPPASKYSPDMSQHFIWGDKNFDSYLMDYRNTLAPK